MLRLRIIIYFKKWSRRKYLSALTSSMRTLRRHHHVATTKDPTKRKNMRKRMSRLDKATNTSWTHLNQSTNCQKVLNNFSNPSLNFSRDRAKCLRNRTHNCWMMLWYYMQESFLKDWKNPTRERPNKWWANQILTGTQMMMSTTIWRAKSSKHRSLTRSPKISRVSPSTAQLSLNFMRLNF